MSNSPSIQPYPSPAEIPGVMGAEVSDEFQCLISMYQTITRSQEGASYHQGVEQLLRIASRRFGCDSALVVAPISDTVCEVVATSGETQAHYVGQHIQVSNLLTRRLRTTRGYLAIADVSASDPTLLPQQAGMGAFIASHVQLTSGAARALLLEADEPRPSDYGPDDIELLRLTAEGVGFLLDIQQVQPKQEDMAVVAHGPVKSLEEYVERARLPTHFGISARVLDALVARIGQESLALGHIAVALNLSKRTLQRRLQEQNVNFADLRDQVRYHFAIQFLIYEKQNIDKVSEALDFSDRMSFTNAFKRWTGLSPSVFRRLFIDYA